MRVSRILVGSSSTATHKHLSPDFRPCSINCLAKLDFPFPMLPVTRMFEPFGSPPNKFLSKASMPVL